MHAACPSHLVLRGLIIKIVFGKAYKLRSSFLQFFSDPEDKAGMSLQNIGCSPNCTALQTGGPNSSAIPPPKAVRFSRMRIINLDGCHTPRLRHGVCAPVHRHMAPCQLQRREEMWKGRKSRNGKHDCPMLFGIRHWFICCGCWSVVGAANRQYRYFPAWRLRLRDFSLLC
jgi:hypothetical protein